MVVSLSIVSAARQPADLRTRAETSDYAETSSYDDVGRIAKGIASAPDTRASYQTFGKTEEGRELPLLILFDPPVSTPQAVLPTAHITVII